MDVIAKKRSGVSVLQGNEFFFNKVISRNSSVGCSSRVFYYRSNGEGVPFQWEMQPGTPKEPPKQEIIPPLSPPPAVLSLALPKPCIDIENLDNKISIRSRLKFWKHIKKISKNKKKVPHQEFRSQGNNNIIVSNASKGGCDKFDNGFEFCSSDDEFMVSPRNLSFSSSSSMSCSNGTHHSRQSSRLESSTTTYSPWNFTSFLVCVMQGNKFDN